MSQGKQQKLKTEVTENQAQKERIEQEIATTTELSDIVRRVSSGTTRRPGEIVTLQRKLGNRTVQRLLDGQARQRPGDATPGGEHPALASSKPADGVIQRQDYTDLYERSQKLNELRQKKFQLQLQLDAVNQALNDAKDRLHQYQMDAGEKEKPVSFVDNLVENLLEWGSYKPGDAGRKQREVMRKMKRAKANARKTEKLIKKGEERKKEIEEKIKAVDDEIAALSV